MPDSSLSLEYAEAADRLFADIADPQSRILGKVDPQRTWTALEEVMFPAAWVPEAAGGAGLSAGDVGQIVEAAGRHAVSEPLVDTILARHWAAEAGLALPAEGSVIFTTECLKVQADGELQGRVRSIPDDPSKLVALGAGPDGPTLLRVERNQTGQIVLDGQLSEASAVLRASPITLQASAAALASAWIAGALRGLLSLCVSYAGERQAFGRTISKFQAIQHHIAQLATEVAAAELSARVALSAIDAGGGVFEAAAAKARVDEAGRTGCRIAHQVFGAIGFTIEHPLHLYTGGIERWRNRYGTGPEWATRIGHAALVGGGAMLWPSITSPDQLSAAMQERADA